MSTFAEREAARIGCVAIAIPLGSVEVGNRIRYPSGRIDIVTAVQVKYNGDLAVTLSDSLGPCCIIEGSATDNITTHEARVTVGS